MGCSCCGENDYAELVSKKVEVHNLEYKLRKLRQIVDEVISWDYGQLIIEDSAGREFYRELKRLEDYRESEKTIDPEKVRG